MVSAALIAGALVAQAAPPALVPGCALVAPDGASIGFKMAPWESADDTMGLIPTGGSVWPTAVLVGDGVTRMPARYAGRAWAFGGDEGIIVLLGDAEAGRDWQPVTLFRRAGARIGLPLAYGFCRPAPRDMIHPAYDPANEYVIGDGIAAFDPARWPEGDCALILQSERRLRIRYGLQNAATVRFQSADLWGRRPLSAALTRDPVQQRGVGRARFERRGGPAGDELFFVDEAGGSAVKLLTFRDVGGAGARDQAGFAICGYRGITRRAAQQ